MKIRLLYIVGVSLCDRSLFFIYLGINFGRGIGRSYLSFGVIVFGWEFFFNLF